MRRAIAQGTFDIPHPSHVHYLPDVASLGDKLHVIIVCGEDVMHRPRPILDGRQRRDMIAALDVVGETHLGHVEDIFVPIKEIDPDIIALGYNRHHGEDGIKATLDACGIDCEVTRATPRELRHDGESLPTGRITDRIVEWCC